MEPKYTRKNPIPQLNIYAGGHGGKVGLGCKAADFRATGAQDPNCCHLFADYATQPYSDAIALQAGIPAELLPVVRPKPTEIIRIGREREELRQIAAAMRLRDPRYTFLYSTLPPSMLDQIIDAKEAARLKRYGQFAVAIAETKPHEEGSGTDHRMSSRISAALEHLRPGGDAFRAMKERLYDELPEPVRVNIVAGANGGTGTAVSELAALFVRYYAAKHGIPVEVFLFYIAGEYAKNDGESASRLAVGGMAADDFAGGRNAHYREFAVGPDQVWSHAGHLYDQVIPFYVDSPNAGTAIQVPARTITWLTRSAAASAITQGWTNAEAARRLQ